MLNLQRKNQSLMGIESYFEDHWTYFRADLRARDDEGWTDMELVGVDDAGHFSSVKVSVFSLPFFPCLGYKNQSSQKPIRFTVQWYCPCCLMSSPRSTWTLPPFCSRRPQSVSSGPLSASSTKAPSSPPSKSLQRFSGP